MVMGVFRTLGAVTLALALTHGPALAQADAVREAQQLTKAGDFAAAARILRAHLAHQPGDIDAARLLGQTLYWAGDTGGARAVYEAALQRHPGHHGLQLDYARMLVETGDAGRARLLLVPLIDAPDARAQARMLLGTLAYWEGDLTSAARLFSAALASDPANADAGRQLHEIRTATPPWARVAFAAWHDDQPLDWRGLELEAGFFAAPLTPIRARLEPRRYGTGGASWMMWRAEAEVRHYVPGARLELELAGGALQRTIDGARSTAMTGRSSAGFRLPHHVKILGRVERRPYLYTTASLETPVMVNAAAAELHLNHPRGWLGQAAVERQQYPDGNALRTAYAWMLVPIVRAGGADLQAGYVFSTEDADESRFVPADAALDVPGLYEPYYTPARVVKHAAIGATALRLSPRATLRAGGSVAIRATEDAPVFVQAPGGLSSRVFEPRAFTPWDARASLDVAAGDRATIALSGETGRSAYYQWARAGVGVTWRFTSGARRLSVR
jgi:tetratricopeptide (TPR) repeat protein